MTTKQTITYVIRSNKNGRYLSHLFEDTHAKTFQSSSNRKSECYHWNVLEVAKRVAAKEGGMVEVVTEKETQ